MIQRTAGTSPQAFYLIALVAAFLISALVLPRFRRATSPRRVTTAMRRPEPGHRKRPR